MATIKKCSVCGRANGYSSAPDSGKCERCLKAKPKVKKAKSKRKG